MRDKGTNVSANMSKVKRRITQGKLMNGNGNVREGGGRKSSEHGNTVRRLAAAFLVWSKDNGEH